MPEIAFFSDSRLDPARKRHAFTRALLGAAFLVGLAALSACETLMGPDDLAAMRWANPGKSDAVLQAQWNTMDSQDQTDVVDAHTYQFVKKKPPPPGAVIDGPTQTHQGNSGKGGHSAH